MIKKREDLINVKDFLTLQEIVNLHGQYLINKLLAETPQMTGAQLGEEWQWIEFTAAVKTKEDVLVAAYYYQLAEDLISTDCLENLTWIPTGFLSIKREY